MVNGTRKRVRLAVAGMLLLLSSCVSGPLRLPNGLKKPDAAVMRIQEQIGLYHNWLQANGFLLRRQGRQQERRGPLDPDTLELLPPEPGPTPEEVKKMMKELMEDPDFHRIIRDHERGEEY